MNITAKTMYEIPALLIDPTILPPPLITSDVGSFAHRTLKVRIPKVLSDTIAANDFPPDIVGELEALYDEITAGVIRNLREDTPDRAFWDPASAPYIGRTWLDVPWFWAEAYYYRRVLEATGYFRPGPGQWRDPYASIKAKEWAPDAAPRTVEEFLQTLPEESDERFERLFHACLWGNRVDLSYNIAGHLGSTASKDAESENLLVDNTARVWAYLRDIENAGIAVLCDNAGTELLMDLALVDFLLSEGYAERVTLHLKEQPYFVSDAMPKDFHHGLDALALGGEQAGALAARARSHLARGRLRLSTHWFNTTSLFYFQLPPDLLADLSAMDLVLVKGDANYRRLHGDAKWPYTTPFDRVVSYFPAPMTALRTLKGEHVLGLEATQIERLQAEDPDWMVNGRRGVIQSRIGR